MKNNIIILSNIDSDRNKKWTKIGTVVNELSELYQIVKETEIDLIILGVDRTDLPAQVAIKIRRYNGLTDIWKATTGNQDGVGVEDYFDGSFSVDIGEKGITNKIAQILHSKKLLAKYNIVSRSSKMKQIAETIHRIAPTDVPVLIIGASGVGKELVAKAIHQDSKQVSDVFVAINCGAIAEGLLESELFGHEKGAFTGSVLKREGLFHKAHNGILFLDEIGETKPEMQVKLLRVLEDGTYYPVGSSSPKFTNVRIVSATNRDLLEAIAEKKFREDLYFRIGVVKIVLPPLFERKNDIQPLLKYFWRTESLDYSDSALELLMQYDWPGNVRQLKNFADRMVALRQKGTVDKEDVLLFVDEQHSNSHNLPVSTGKSSEQAGQELIYHAILSLGSEIKMLRDLITTNLPSGQPQEVQPDTADTVKGLTVEQMEIMMIRQVLLETNGNRKEAAKRLGVGERTLYRKLNKYNLS